MKIFNNFDKHLQFESEIFDKGFDFRTPSKPSYKINLRNMTVLTLSYEEVMTIYKQIGRFVELAQDR